tara:strand:+ start:2724 stop:2918 length:195 start_codon:yes stop_codon:yes gene_type:complete
MTETSNITDVSTCIFLIDLKPKTIDFQPLIEETIQADNIWEWLKNEKEKFINWLDNEFNSCDNE